jgi:hypothetical protein
MIHHAMGEKEDFPRSKTSRNQCSAWNFMLYVLAERDYPVRDWYLENSILDLFGLQSGIFN